MRISDWSSDVCSSDLSQANEAGMPDHAFGSEFSKGDFGDKLGLHPMHPAAHFTRHIQGGGVLGKGRHLFPQILQHIRTEAGADAASRSEEHTSELQSLMRISYAVFCLKKKTNNVLP